jgi:hypothetical protein
VEGLGSHRLPKSAAAMPVYTCNEVAPVTSRLAGVLAQGRNTALQGRAQELAVLNELA